MATKKKPRKPLKLWGTTVFKDTIIDVWDQDIIKKVKPIHKKVGQYVQSTSSTLSTKGPMKNIRVGNISNEFITLATGPNGRKNIEHIIKQVPGIKSNMKTMHNPFTMLLSCMIFIYHNNGKPIMSNKVDMGKVLTFFLTLKVYYNAYAAFFHHDPNPDLMDYTIENLNNNRFNIRKYGTIFKTLQYLSESHYENFQDILQMDVVDDRHVVYYIENITNRVRLMIHEIATAFYANVKAGIQPTTDVLEKEGDDGSKYLPEITNVSSIITISSRAIYHLMISSNIPDPELMRIACKRTKASLNKMTIAMSNVLEADEILLKELITKIIAYYVTKEGKTQFKSSHFIKTSTNVYSISHSVDANVIEIKEILTNILSKHSEAYVKSNHTGTLSSYKFSIYLYVVLFIAKNS